MIAKPSIAFNDFSGTAKDVTARNVQGRNVLSVRAYQSKVVTPAQATTRNQLSKISREYKQLSDSQMHAWEVLAQHLKGISVLGSSAEMTGHNAFVRINVNRRMAGESLLLDAPSHIGSIPNVSYTDVVMTPKMILFGGVKHEPSPFKMVVKMSGSQSPGISNGWSKTVIISSAVEEDWGEADITTLYLSTIGIKPTPGQKVFIEVYYMNTDTGMTGQVLKDSVIVTGEGESSYTPRKRVTMDRLAPDHEQHVSSIDVDFSSGAPVVQFDVMCEGHSNVASSEAYLADDLPAELQGTSWALGRGNGADGKLVAQSYVMWLYGARYGNPAYITFAHRGGYYVKPTEVFGPGIIY